VDAEFQLLRDYASQRNFLQSLASSDDATAQRAKEILARTAEVAEGKEEDAATFPQLAIVWNSKRDEPFGSGIHLGGRVVLTATHVAASVQPDKVSIGVANINERFGANDHDVVSVLLRVTNALQWDIAVLLLKDSVKAKGPTRLATGAEFTAETAAPVTVCGFGWGWPQGHPEQARPGVKRSIAVPLVANTSALNPANLFVTGDLEPDAPFKNICRFDSGAPAFVMKGDELLLLGIASRTLDPEASKPEKCGARPEGIFSRVDAGRGWILDALKL
jgi:secreted trypsin-like serine protease